MNTKITPEIQVKTVEKTESVKIVCDEHKNDKRYCEPFEDEGSADDDLID